MAQGRARTARPTRGGTAANVAPGRGSRSAAGNGRTAASARAGRTGGGGRKGGGGIPWLGLGLLLAIGVGVVVARTLGFSRAEQARSTEPTLMSVRQATSSTAGTAQPARGTVAPTPAAAATAARAHGTSVPAGAPTPAATPHTTGVPAVITPRTATGTPGSAAPTPSGAGGVTALATATPNNTATRGTSGTGFSGTPTAAPSGLAPSGTTGSAGGVALTFDAGADRGYAEDILDVLQSEHVVASFGITGNWAKANPELVRRMAADGHMVINHTLDHHSFTGVSDQRGALSATRRRAELDDADAIIAPLLGHSTQPWYRLPYGDDDAHVTADVRPAGYTHKVGWTVDSFGWRGVQAPDIVARCLGLAAPGGVYVLHVGRASQDASALPQIIHGLRDKGFSFHRVDQA